MTTAPVQHKTIQLESLGFFDDVDDENGENEGQAVMASTGRASSTSNLLQPRSTNPALDKVMSSLNSLAASSSSKRTAATYGPAAETNTSRWGQDLDDELDLEEELAREAEMERESRRGKASSSKETEWGAMPDFPEQEDIDEEQEDGDELEALMAAEGSPKSNVPINSRPIAERAKSTTLQLEDNGLLGSDDEDDLDPPRAPPHTTGAQPHAAVRLTSPSESRSNSATPQPGPSSSRRPLLRRPVDTTEDTASLWAAASSRITSLSSPTATDSASAGASTSTRHDTAIPKYIPAGHLPVISMGGETLRFERTRRLRGWKAPPPHYGEATTTGLLSRPVHQIMDAVRAQLAEDVVRRSEEDEMLAAAAAAETARFNSLSARKKKEKTAAVQNDGKVWVEKYRPKRFAELLGDERVHREVMSWLKEWDPCVFKRRNHRRKRMQEAESAAPGGPGASVEFRDPYDRPAQRVLLISGAPGLGKTTLAHVLAKAAGYGVYELNASDSRSASAVTDTIKMALESSSLRDARPTCLVVDEIDGATGGGGAGGGGGEESRGFIKALVDLVEGGKGGKKAKGAKGGPGAKGKKTKPLLRPIICVCNDLYAPALRPLRPYCRLIRFQKPAQNHLVGRLKGICEAESLSASSRTLSTLASLSQGDIRSCLNALQLAKLKRLRQDRLNSSDDVIEITESDIREAGVGIKDGSTSLQTVWAALFRTPTPKERARRLVPAEGPALTQHLVSLVQSSGEYNRVLQGCFEHYPNLNFIDDGWWRIRSMLSWVDWGTEMQDRAFANGMFDLLGYVPWSFVRWNTLFANTVNTLPEWPRVDYEHRLKRQAFDEIALELHGSLPPSLRTQFGRDATIRELGPALMRILTPDLKPVNHQIVRPAERKTLQSLVDIMLHLSLSFVRDRLPDDQGGSLYYRLEPPLEVFTSFDGKRGANVNVGRYAVRQIVMRELDAERIRRRNAKDGDGEKGGGGGSSSRSAQNALQAYKRSDGGGEGAEDGTGGGARKKQKVALDFFGRPVVPKTKAEPPRVQGSSLPASILAARAKSAADRPGVKAEEAGTEPPTSSPGTRAQEETRNTAKDRRLKVHYRYNEGYSNAVRQPLKMSALL